MANGEKDNQEETYRHRQSVQVRPCWTVATCTQDWLQQFLRGKNDVKNWFEFWQILPGICLGGVCTRIAWFVINSLQTGIVPKITWKKFNGDKENKKIVDNNLKTVKEVLSNDDDGLPAWCPTFRRRAGFDLRKKHENWKRAQNQKMIYVSCEKVVRGSMKASSVSLSLSERGRQPAKKLHSLVNVHNGR